MSIERELIIALLKIPQGEPFLYKQLNKMARISTQHVHDLLQKLQNDGLVNVDRGFVSTNSTQRLKMAIQAIQLGADLERVNTLLQWQEFEEMAAFVLEQNDYVVTKNLRFSHKRRKWEIDIVGCKKPLVACIDCKHWHHMMHPSELRKVAEEQLKRIKALKEKLPAPKIQIKCVSWTNAVFVPIILSLVEGTSKFYKGIPIVPVLKLQDFLTQLPAYATELQHYTKSFSSNKLFSL